MTVFLVDDVTTDLWFWESVWDYCVENDLGER